MGDSPKWVKSRRRRKKRRERKNDTPGTAGGPGGRDRTLAVKSRKTAEKITFFLKKIKFTPKKYFFLHISSSYAKILGGEIISHMGDSPKWVKSRRRRKKRRERKKD